MNNNKVVVIDLLGSLFEYKQDFFKLLSDEIYNRYNKRICNKTIEKWLNNKHFIEGLEKLSESIGENITHKEFEQMFIAAIFDDNYSIRKCITKRRHIRDMLQTLREKNIAIVTYSFLDDKINHFILKNFKLSGLVDLHLKPSNSEYCIFKEINKWFPKTGNISLISSSTLLDQYYKEHNFNSYCFDIKEIKESALYIYSSVMFANFQLQKCA